MSDRWRFTAFAFVTFVTGAVHGGGAEPAQAPAQADDTGRLVRRARELTGRLATRPLDPAASAEFLELCETREKLYQYQEAARCYREVHETWPQLAVGREALWSAAQLHRRLQDYPAALELYTRVALDRAFDASRRSDARALAASLRRHLRQPRRPK